MAFVRWNQTTSIWEKAVTPENPSTAWNHLPISDPTQALDTANKQYVDAKVASITGFVPYTGATANVNLGAFAITAQIGLFNVSVNTDNPTINNLTGTGLAVRDASKVYGLNFGISNSGNAWIQAQRFDSVAATYNIRLNPMGGDVTMGGNLFVFGKVNEQSRAQFMGDFGAYTPVWKSYGGTTGVIGNGTLVGRFSRVGKTVFFVIRIHIGGTTVLPSGQWLFTLPFPTAGSPDMVGSVMIYNGTSGAVNMGTVIPASYFFGIQDAIGMIATHSASGTTSQSFVGPVWPLNWTVNDSMFINGFYEQA